MNRHQLYLIHVKDPDEYPAHPFLQNAAVQGDPPQLLRIFLVAGVALGRNGSRHVLVGR